MDEEQLRQLFEQVRLGAVDVDSALHRLRHMPFEDLGFAKVDHHRALRHGMPEVIFGKGKSPEQIVAKLRQIEVLMSQGKTVPLACKEAGIVDQTYYRWRKEFGGLQLEQAKKLKDLQKENAQLKRALATLTLEKQVLKDIAEGNF